VNGDAAMAFLRGHQPLPETLDDNLHRGLLETWEYLRDHPEPGALPLLLTMFGAGDAGGIYQRFDDVLAGYPPDDVVAELARQLAADRRPARYWSVLFAAGFPDERLVAPLGEVLREDDGDLRSAAVTVLERIGTPAAIAMLREALGRERDRELGMFIQDSLDHLDSPDSLDPGGRRG
jgi:hypothetical protein